MQEEAHVSDEISEKSPNADSSHKQTPETSNEKSNPHFTRLRNVIHPEPHYEKAVTQQRF